MDKKIIMVTKRRPSSNEYASFYGTYVGKVEGNDFLAKLKEQKASTISFLEKLPEEKWDYKYGEDKWSIKELLIHMIDTERIFSYRALRISRNDRTPIEGFEQDDYVPYSQAGQRSAASILAEYEAVRNSTIHLFQNFTDENMNRIGTASGASISVRALGFITTGHEVHHMQILKERYF